MKQAFYCAGMAEATRYRCDSCGNKTRFDVFETRRTRSFHHYTLGGELTIEEQETLDATVEKVVCRWCGSPATVADVGNGR